MKFYFVIIIVKLLSLVVLLHGTIFLQDEIWNFS